MNDPTILTLVILALVIAVSVVAYAMGRYHQHHVEQRIKWDSEMRRPTRV